MATTSFLVLIPSNGAPLTSEAQLARAPVDPFRSPPLSAANFFEIEDWSMDVAQTLAVGSAGSGAGAGKVTFNPFSITRRIDKASVSLFIDACAGKPFTFVDLVEQRVTGDPSGGTVYLGWRFGLCAVSTVAWRHDEEAPVETVTFQYGSLSMAYAQQQPDGSLGTFDIEGWDRVRNVKI